MPARQPVIPGFGPDDEPPVSPAEPTSHPQVTPAPPAGFAARFSPRPPTPGSFASRIGPRPSLFDRLPQPPPHDPSPTSPATTAVPPAPAIRPETSAGAAGKARDLLAAIRTLRAVEREGRPASAAERDALARFPGFGAVALSIFPNPSTGSYPDAGWQARGEELAALLSPDEYASAKRTTFSQYFTSPAVMAALHAGLTRLGVPAGATVLEPGCGTGNFLTGGHRYVGVELDAVTGRIARLLHPAADIRVENFRDTRLPPLDGVIGNVPFADLKIEHGRAMKLSLHDYFFAKSVDALKPGGVSGAASPRRLHARQTERRPSAKTAGRPRRISSAPIRLPSDAFKRARYVGRDGHRIPAETWPWLRRTGPRRRRSRMAGRYRPVEPSRVPTVLDQSLFSWPTPRWCSAMWSRKDTLYGGEGVQRRWSAGDLAERAQAQGDRPTAPRFVADSRLRHGATEPAFRPRRSSPAAAAESTDLRRCRFFINERPGTICQDRGWADRDPCRTACVRLLRSDGAMTGPHASASLDSSFATLLAGYCESQNEGWPAKNFARTTRQRTESGLRPIRQACMDQSTRRRPARPPPSSASSVACPISSSSAKIRTPCWSCRWRSTTKPRARPPKPQSSEKGRRRARSPPITSVRSRPPKKDCWSPSTSTGAVDVPFIARTLRQSAEEPAVIAELGDLVFHDPATGR